MRSPFHAKNSLFWVGLPLCAVLSIPFAWATWTDFFNLSVRKASHDFVQDCAGQVAVGTTVPVKYSWKQLCNKTPDATHPPYLGDATDFVLSREPDLTSQNTDGTTTSEKRVGVTAEILLDIRSPEEFAWAMLPPKKQSQKKQPARLSSDLRARIVENSKACMPVINRYWNHYGVDLNFSFAEKEPSAEYTANTVLIIDGPGRSNSKMFYYAGLDNEMALPKLPDFLFMLQNLKVPAGLTKNCVDRVCGPGAGKVTDLKSDCSDRCEAPREEEYCNTMAHELGHRLGLPDEYADPVYCKDRPFVSQESMPYSMMAVPQVGMLDSILPAGVRPPQDQTVEEFYPRSLKRVVGPLCGQQPETELD